MELLVDITLLAFLVILGLAIICQGNLFSAVILAGMFSLINACLYVSMDAVDVAFTEAAVGGGIASLLFLSTIAATTSQEKSRDTISLPACAVVVFTACVLMFGVADIPRFGSGQAPVHQYLSARYIDQSLQETGVPNMVTSVLASYRGYDTMGEVAVIFTAGIAVLMLLGRRTGCRMQPYKKRDL